MLDFRSDKPKPQPPPYAIDRRRGPVRAKALRSREWRLILMLPGAVILLGWLIWSLTSQYRTDLARLGEAPVAIAPGPPPMRMPVLDGADPLPDPAAIAAQAGAIAELRADPLRLPAVVGTDLDAVTLAWGLPLLEADRAAPPIPGRPTVADLVSRELHLGAPVILGGRLVDARQAEAGDGAGPWRLLIALDDAQYATALLVGDGSALVAGEEVQVVGRFAGIAGLPAAEGGPPVRLPLVLARSAARVDAADDPLREYHTGFSGLPPGALADIDDERTVVETRPYYYLLGKVVADRAFTDPYAGAISANLQGNRLHQDPAAHRGEPASVRMLVFEAWEDRLAARDRPFGVARVVRILGYKRDWSPITVLGQDGKPVEKTQSVMRLFELAVATDKPLPERGQLITADGRFMKMRAIPVTPDPQRDRLMGIARQRSDRVYAFFIVANDWSIAPPGLTWDFTYAGFAGLALIGALVVMVWWFSRRDARAAAKVPGQVRRLREQRRRHAGGGKEEAASPAAPSDPPAG